MYLYGRRFSKKDNGLIGNIFTKAGKNINTFCDIVLKSSNLQTLPPEIEVG